MCQIAKLKIHRRCKTPEDPAVVVIMWKGERVELCRKCWERIPDDLEWGDSPRPTIKELLSDKSRFGDNPIETEYKPKGFGKHEEQTEEEEYE